MTAAVHKTTRRRLAFLFSLPLAFGIVFFSVSLLTEHTDIDLLRIQDLASGVRELRSIANDIETGERGFLLTGDERYLIPLKQANATLPGEIDACARYAKNQPADLQREARLLVSLVRQRADIASNTMAAQKSAGFAAAVAMMKTGTTEDLMTQIRSTASNLEVAIGSRELQFIESQRNLNRGAFLFFALGSLLMVGVMAWLYHTLISHIQGRDSANAQLQALNAQLEARIQQRTADLTMANEELQQFAYVASHDLQEPLRTITSFTQLLQTRYKGRLDEDADEFMGFIVASSRRMTDLINGLLALVRLRKSGQPTAPVSFEKLLDDAEINLQAAIRESGARIEHGPLPSLVVDKVQFAQVLQNLISNAIKYRRDEPVRIRVDAKRDATNWVFSVSDNSRGFNQQFAERIFGLFQRLHGREVEGTGMGLSITKKILERHGGRIWAESVEGKGSTFYFSLPCSLETLRAEEPKQAMKTAAQA